MVINCTICGRPAVALDLPEFQPVQQSIVRRTLKGLLDFDLAGMLPQLEALLKSDPSAIAATFNLRCMRDGCKMT